MADVITTEELLKNTCLYRFNDKDSCVLKYTTQMLNRLATMFEWSKLDELIDIKQFEKILKTEGAVGVKRINGKFEILKGGFGGELDAKYRPVLWVGANPGLKEKQSYSYKIFYGDNDVPEEDAVIVFTNDTMLQGVLPVINRYSTMLVENDITMRISLILSRMSKNFITQDDDTALSIGQYMKDIEDGKLSVITTSFLDENEKIFNQATSANSEITNLIELQQYLKASLYNEFGLNANYNMKRESITAGESQLNFDALLPMVEDYLHNRERGCEQFNKLYEDVNIDVKLHGVWRELQQEHENAIINGTTDEMEADEEQGDSEAVEPVNEEVSQDVAQEVAQDVAELVEDIIEVVEPIEEEEDKDEVSD